MIQIVATTVLDHHVVAVTCHHGWRDKTGHPLFRGSAEVREDGPVDLVATLADVLGRLAHAAGRGDLELTDDCGR